MIFSNVDFKKIESTDINLGRTNHISKYTYSSIYEEYILNKIDNEEKIASHLKTIIPVQEAKYKNIRTLNESVLGDKAKNRFNKIVSFVKNLLAKFAESISSFLLDNKDYLDKYKDIILKKEPKSDNSYSYTGDYKIGMQRCMNFELHQFKFLDYNDYIDEEDADKARVAIATKVFNNDANFKFAVGDSLSDAAKEYFLAYEKGDQEGTFDDGKLNFTDMYNFCYNVGQITKIKNRDEKFIEASNKEILAELEKRVTERDKKNNAESSTKPEDSNAAPTKPEDGNTTPTKPEGDKSAEKESFAFSALDIYRSKYLMEDTTTDASNKQNNDNGKPKPTNTLKITSANNAISAISKNNTNGNNDDKNANSDIGTSDAELSKIQTLCDRYYQVVRTVIAARCTALEQMARNYMEIIRAHVRSYVGNTKDTSTDRSQQAGNTYQKDNGNNQTNNTESPDQTKANNQDNKNNKTKPTRAKVKRRT